MSNIDEKINELRRSFGFSFIPGLLTSYMGIFNLIDAYKHQQIVLQDQISLLDKIDKGSYSQALELANSLTRFEFYTPALCLGMGSIFIGVSLIYLDRLKKYDVGGSIEK